ncbi:MAG: trehalose-phosphatase [Anaerolineae bacterium]|nr:trehalose-phosphatase [Anaerolineae bacterium]
MGKDKPTTAIIHYTAPPVIGGVEMVVRAHAQVFIRHGYPVAIITGRGEKESLPPGCDLVVIPEIDSQHPEILEASVSLEEGRVPANFDQLTKRLSDSLRPLVEQFDNVIVHNIFTKHFNLPLTAALIELLDSGAIRHCIAWCHDFTWTSPRSQHKVHPGDPWDMLRTCRADMDYVVVSQQRQQTLADLMSCPPEQIEVIYNGVDPASMLGLSGEGKALIERLGWLESDLNILMPVRVTKAKNIEYALLVVAALKKQGCSPKLLVTGPPDPHDPVSLDYFHELQEMRRSLKVENEMRFVFESGPEPDAPLEIPMAVVGELYRAADLMFMPSHREGFGMPVVEAGLVGLPVFSTEIPAAAEIGGDDIVIFDKTDEPGRIAAKILKWIEANPLSRFRRCIRRSYTWDAIFRDQIIPLINERQHTVTFPPHLMAKIEQAGRLYLFLDYDGTLADFAPTPDIVEPDLEVAEIVRQLADNPRIRTAIISGRRLDQIVKLVPVEGILRAGTYGIEMLTAQGESISRVDYDEIRPVLDSLKPIWASLIEGHDGFFLEDKDWSLALHARWADNETGEQVLIEARRRAAEIAPGNVFRILGGDRFLEVGPTLAHKGKTIEYLLDADRETNSLPLYIGDDDKDEEAFEVIKARGGIAVVVDAEPRDTVADHRLESPQEARRWLRQLSEHLK